MLLPWQYRWTALSCWSFPASGGQLDVDADIDELPIPSWNNHHSRLENSLEAGRSEEIIQRGGTSSLARTFGQVWGHRGQ